MEQEETNIKFPKPLITVVDTEPSIAECLQDTGYNVLEGSFGVPYRGQETDNYQNLFDNSYFPTNFAESEIIIVDLATRDAGLMPHGDRIVDGNDESIMVHTLNRIVDPRPYAMRGVVEVLDRIYAHGGVFIIFAEAKTGTHVFKRDDMRGGYRAFVQFNNWEFLSILSQGAFDAKPDRGAEITIELATDDKIVRVLSEHCLNTSFSAKLEFNPPPDTKENWFPLATNKYGETVAAKIQAENGCIFLFPHVRDKAAFVLDLIADALPHVSPHLFPYNEVAPWIVEDKYQPVEVVKLRKKIDQIRADTERQISNLKVEIGAVQEEYQYLFDLLTQNDDPLVHAVEKALEVLGFEDVLNYDEELKRRGTNELREDLHIRDQSPLVLAEVKGVHGTSTENDALEVKNYLFPRAKELDRTDLRGLTIMNHQRSLPPLTRDQQPFSDDVITTAQNSHIGLLTTWNLFKLVRNYLELGWKPEFVKELFYQDGFIEPIPLHYQYVGTVQRYMEKDGTKVAGIAVEKTEFRLHDRIAFELPVDFKEQTVESLQLNNKPVETVPVGELVGIETEYTKKQLRTGVRVYRVSEP